MWVVVVLLNGKIQGVLHDIYSLQVTRTYIALSGFRLDSYSLGAEWAD